MSKDVFIDLPVAVITIKVTNVKGDSDGNDINGSEEQRNDNAER